MKVLVVILAFVVTPAVFLFATDRGDHYVVLFTSDGFQPKTLTVEEGDIVTFKSGGLDFWPASDPHPSHSYLVGFDPGRVVDKSGSWSHRFTSPGSWRFHDHLSTLFKGEIVVVPSYDSKYNPAETRACTEDDCYLERIKELVAKESVEAAFSYFSEIFDRQETMGCHWTSHYIGEAAADKVIRGGYFKTTVATAYCGYGFYHGFMEKVLHSQPNASKAVEFCENAGKEIGRQARDNCVHGIGHGFTENPPPKEKWGKPFELAKPGLEVCKKVFGGNLNDVAICGTGVFNVLASLMHEGKFNFEIDENNPFAYCRSQEEVYKKACYSEFSARLDHLAGWDVTKLERFVSDVRDRELANTIVRVAVGGFMQRDISQEDHTNYVSACRSLEGRDLQVTCIGAVGWGLVTNGKPEEEHKKFVKFCGSDLLAEEEAIRCFEESVTQMSSMYRSEKMIRVCEMIDVKVPACAAFKKPA